MKKQIQIKGMWPSFEPEILKQNGYQQTKYGAYKDGQHYKVFSHVMRGDFEDGIYQPHSLTLIPVSATQAKDKDFMLNNSSKLMD